MIRIVDIKDPEDYRDSEFEPITGFVYRDGKMCGSLHGVGAGRRFIAGAVEAFGAAELAEIAEHLAGGR